MARVPAGAELQRAVEERDWYHTIELGDGVVTPGWFDTRATVDKVPLPRSLAGLRCLDVGTWDGFWAFEMERRGAASVTALDVEDPWGWDWPAPVRLDGDAAEVRIVEGFKSSSGSFALAAEALGSRVERLDLSVYDLDPDRVGRFDLVFMGTLLLHLRDPVLALERIRSVCAGEAVFADSVELLPSLLRPRTPTARLEGGREPWWWQPNVAALRGMVRSAGWRIVETVPLYRLPLGTAHPRPPLPGMWRLLLSAGGRERVIVRLAGIPHTAVRARPLGD